VRAIRILAILALAAPALPVTTHAADVYAEECGACHLAYPSRLLSAADWGRVLDDLAHHYGVDATLDEPARQTVAQRHGLPLPAASTAPATLPRITTSRWFVDEHDDVSVATFRSASVRSAANCAACHAGAARGDVDEDDVRIPGARP
jgi:hypothetical protein